ncbi:MAG: hypothetical protein CMQ34_09840 [Gammaproteobacteria bacterium]|nr:hypothetical protein [Gammaproteobacteria bacterium]|tara:strand:+ start:308 stop:571 length:264 start_codon:yes stop_codon:yes gene_type:complete
MAIQTDYDFRGIRVKDAYIKILHFGGNAQFINFTVGVFANVEKAGEGEKIDEVYFDMMPFDIDAGNPLRQAYGKLKQISRFANAADV